MRADPDELATAPLDSGRSTAEMSVLPPSQSVRSSQSGKSKWILAGLVILGIVAGTIVFRTGASKSPGAGSSVGRSDTPVPVITGVVSARDIPIYLDGLGTVQAFNTVSIHSRVDGQLVKVKFSEGQDINSGDVIAQLDPAPYQAAYDQAMARKAQDEAQLANARIDLQRYVNLLKTDSITQQIYDTQKSLLTQLEATVKADQASVDSARVNLDYTTVRSPISGRAGIRQVDHGNIIHANDAGSLVVVTQLRPISVVFTLPEQMLPKLQEHASDFTVLAVSRDNTNVLAEGRLAVIDNQIDATSGTLKLKATFPNEDLRLWPGQFVNTRLHLTTRQNGLVVPASVVQRGPEGAFAYVIQKDDTVVVQHLKVAQIERGEALIDDGLKLGDKVVVDGQYKLQPGSHIKSVDNNRPEGRVAIRPDRKS